MHHAQHGILSSLLGPLALGCLVGVGMQLRGWSHWNTNKKTQKMLIYAMVMVGKEWHRKTGKLFGVAWVGFAYVCTYDLILSIPHPPKNWVWQSQTLTLFLKSEQFNTHPLNPGIAWCNSSLGILMLKAGSQQTESIAHNSPQLHVVYGWPLSPDKDW